MNRRVRIVTSVSISVLVLMVMHSLGIADPIRLLNAENPVANYPFNILEAGESCALFELNSRDTFWADKTNKGLVLHVAVDGRFANDIVVQGLGEEAPSDASLFREYSACLGELPAGNHELTLTLDRAVSPAEQGSVEIDSFEIRTVTQDQSDYLLVKYAPMLYERVAEKGSDISLLLFANPVSQNGKTTIEYHVVFSNEDGGTGRNPAILMSRYGRVTDIEWVYRVAVDEGTGAILSEQYQGSGHDLREFTGHKIGSHPVLRVATDNGNFEQDGETAVRVGLMPLVFQWGKDKPREAIMDLFPWTFRVSSQEMFAEHKASHESNMRSAMLGDARDYLYIDCDADNFNGKKSLSFEVKLKNAKHWYSTNPGKDVPFLGNDGLIQFSGWYRTDIKLPPGTGPGDIEGIRILGTGEVSYRIKHMRAFMLDERYQPMKPLFELQKSITLTPSKQTLSYPVTSNQ